MLSSKINLFSFASENLLAFKISFIASLWLLISISFLIFLNGLYLQQSEKNKFINDIDLFRTSLKEETDFMDIYSKDDFLSRFKQKELIHRLTRDIMVIRKSWEIVKKWVFKLFDVPTKDIPELDNFIIRTLDERDFILYRVRFSNDSIIFSRDITFIREFQETLRLIALLLWVLFFIIIFIISLQIASMTLRPIQETNRRLKEYNHHVAHELKTPLSVLKSNLELTQLSRNICDLDSSKEEIESLEHIINGLLFLSENTLIQSKQKIDIIPLFENVIDSFITEKEIKLQTSKPHIFVYTEKILFERLLKNLVENALKYSADNIVHIDVKKASFEIRNTIDFDIEKHKLESIFDPFYKLDNSRSSTWYGLGLSIVKRIIDIFKWNISVDTKNKNFITIVRW